MSFGQVPTSPLSMWTTWNATCVIAPGTVSGAGGVGNARSVTYSTTQDNVPCRWEPDDSQEAEGEYGTVLVTGGTITVPEVRGDGTAITLGPNDRVTVGGATYIIEGTWTRTNPNVLAKSARIRKVD